MNSPNTRLPATHHFLLERRPRGPSLSVGGGSAALRPVVDSSNVSATDMPAYLGIFDSDITAAVCVRADVRSRMHNHAVRHIRKSLSASQPVGGRQSTTNISSHVGFSYEIEADRHWEGGVNATAYYVHVGFDLVAELVEAAVRDPDISIDQAADLFASSLPDPTTLLGSALGMVRTTSKVSNQNDDMAFDIILRILLRCSAANDVFGRFAAQIGLSDIRLAEMLDVEWPVPVEPDNQCHRLNHLIQARHKSKR